TGLRSPKHQNLHPVSHSDNQPPGLSGSAAPGSWAQPRAARAARAFGEVFRCARVSQENANPKGEIVRAAVYAINEPKDARPMMHPKKDLAVRILVCCERHLHGAELQKIRPTIVATILSFPGGNSGCIRPHAHVRIKKSVPWKPSPANKGASTTSNSSAPWKRFAISNSPSN